MNLHRARIFNTFAKYQNVVKAAKELCISQPAVSNELKRFQEECGIKLFEKDGRGLKLTQSGLDIFSLTNQLFDIERHIEEALYSYRETQNTIRLGLVSIYERFELPTILDMFSKIDEKTGVVVRSGNTKSLLEFLSSKQIDVAFVGDFNGYPQLISKPYKRHTMYMVIPKTHRLHGKKTFTPQDIRGEKMVLKEYNSSSRMAVEPYLIENNISPIIVAELSNFDALYELVLRENCLTFFPDMAIENIPSFYDKCQIASPVAHILQYSTYIVTQPLNNYIFHRKMFLQELINASFED